MRSNSFTSVHGWLMSLGACALLAGCAPIVSGGGGNNGEDPGGDPGGTGDPGNDPGNGGGPTPDGWSSTCFQTFDEPSCDGARYVSFNDAYQKYVGVILCAADRYKLYLGESADGVFYQIGDYAGHGQDHCELVNPSFTIPNEDDITSGGCSGCATSADSSWYSNPIGTQGYSRANFGDAFEFEPLWPEYNLYTVEWLSCEVSFAVDGDTCGDPDPQPDGWVPNAFTDAGADTPCDGDRFVRYDEGYGLFVGVSLCSATRYKIFLGESADGIFYQIGDYAGHGQDHCELVSPSFTIPNEDDMTSGGCVDCATSADTDWYQNPVGTQGYSRGSYGDSFQFEPTWPQYNLYTVGWYECGISIP